MLYIKDSTIVKQYQTWYTTQIITFSGSYLLVNIEPNNKKHTVLNNQKPVHILIIKSTNKIIKTRKNKGKYYRKPFSF